ncbi:MAG: galactonate dehydratase [Chthonomonadales bacterium]
MAGKGRTVKITQIRCFCVEPRWLFVKIETDEGLCGWGECLGDKAYVIAEAVRSFEHALVGEDPRKIVHHWQSMYRGAFWRGGSTLCAAISGLEMALWDLQGKRLGVPVYELLGGPTRDRVRVYSRPRGSSPKDLAASAREVVKAGFTALKFCPFDRVKAVDHYSVVEEAAERVQAVRDAVGSGVDILLDFHGRLSPAMAILMEEAMREHHPFFIEEPVLPENVVELERVARQFKTPVATGERLFTKWGFREVLERGAASVLQPDPCICGGILEAVHIAAMAECYYASVAPHNPYGPVNLAAALQIDCAIPNFLLQEYVHLGEGYLVKPFEVEGGYIRRPEGPGLGIEINEDYLLERPLGSKPDVGRWFHADDGSVADW